MTLWSSILSSVSKKTGEKHDTIVLMGDRHAGKHTLIQKLISVPTQDAHVAITYFSTPVIDDDREIGVLDFYCVNGGGVHLLQQALPSHRIPHTTFVIVLDWNSPWAMLDSLNAYVDCVRQYLAATLSNDELDKLKRDVIRRIQSFSIADSLKDVSKVQLEVDTSDFPLPPQSLVDNLGVELVVVAAKSDSIGSAEKTIHGNGADLLDFIQQTLRMRALQRLSLDYFHANDVLKVGASLCYTSTHYPQTISSLKQLLLTRSFPRLFKPPAPQIIEQNNILVPAGWDSVGKIAILRDGFEFSVQMFTEMLGTSKPTPPDEPTLTTVENEQDFLAKLLKSLPLESKQAPTNASSSNNLDLASQDSPRSTNAGAPQTDVIANFFQSLLTKKSSGSAGSIASNEALNADGKSSAEHRKAVEAELDKIRGRK